MAALPSPRPAETPTCVTREQLLSRFGMLRTCPPGRRFSTQSVIPAPPTSLDCFVAKAGQHPTSDVHGHVPDHKVYTGMWASLSNMPGHGHAVLASAVVLNRHLLGPAWLLSMHAVIQKNRHADHCHGAFTVMALMCLRVRGAEVHLQRRQSQ